MKKGCKAILAAASAALMLLTACSPQAAAAAAAARPAAAQRAQYYQWLDFSARGNASVYRTDPGKAVMLSVRPNGDYQTGYKSAGTGCYVLDDAQHTAQRASFWKCQQ